MSATDWNNHWGNWIRHRIKHLGLKNHRVAKAARTSPANLSKWMKRPEMPGWLQETEVQALADVLLMHPSALEYAHLSQHEISPYSEGFIDTASGNKKAHEKWASLKRPEIKEPTTPEEEVELRDRNTVIEIAHRLKGTDLRVLVQVAFWIMGDLYIRESRPEDVTTFLRADRAKTLQSLWESREK